MAPRGAGYRPTMSARVTDAHAGGQRRHRLSRWPTVQPQVPPLEAERTFDRIVEESRQRLGRSHRCRLVMAGIRARRAGRNAGDADDPPAAQTETVAVRLVPAVIVGFLLVAAHLNHSIVSSISCFAGILAGAPFGYAAWAQLLAIAVAGNLIGGLALVTMLRLMQVPHKVVRARRDQAA